MCLKFGRKNEKCIYVGMGSERRAHDFIRRNLNWKRVTKGERPTVVLLDEKNDYREALDCEKYHISRMKYQGFDLANKEPAKYWLGIKRSEVDPETMEKFIEAGNTPEAIEKRAAQLRGRKQSEEHIKSRVSGRAGYAHTDETKQKMSLAKIGRPNGLLGKTRSEETKRKISESRKNSEAVKNQWEKIKATKIANGTYYGFKSSKAKAIVCIETGKEYRCAKDAATELGFNEKNIQQCCKGDKKSHAGFTWKYKG